MNNSLEEKLHKLFGTSIIPSSNKQALQNLSQGSSGEWQSVRDKLLQNTQPATSTSMTPNTLESFVMGQTGTQTGLGLIPTSQPRPSRSIETTPSAFKPSPRLEPKVSKEMKKTLSDLGIEMPKNVSSAEFPLFVELAVNRIKSEGKQLKPEQQMSLLSSIYTHADDSATKKFNVLYPVGGVERTKMDSEGKTMEVFDEFRNVEVQNLITRIPGLKEYISTETPSLTGGEGEVGDFQEGNQIWRNVPRSEWSEFQKVHINAKRIK